MEVSNLWGKEGRKEQTREDDGRSCHFPYVQFGTSWLRILPSPPSGDMLLECVWGGYLGTLSSTEFHFNRR